MEKLKPYLDAVSESASRVRKLIFVIITASVLFFIPEWNEFPTNWGNSRIEIVRAGLKYWGWSPSVRQGLATDDPAALDLFDRSQRYADLKGIESTNELTKELEMLQGQRGYVIGIPAFDVVIQTNDIGIFSGFSFVVLLVMLRMSVSRALSNLKMTFARTLEDDMKEDRKLREELYNLLSMQQVLTVPPAKHLKRPSALWIYLAKAFIFLPFLVQMTIACNDVYTYKVGLILNPTSTGIALLGNMLFLGFVIMLTGAYLNLSFDYDKVFRKQFKMIFPSAQEDP
jgi:hypothetical protein